MKTSYDNVNRMVKAMAKKRPQGRPTRDNLSERRLVRLTPALDAIVELHRQHLETDPDEPVEFTKALRDLVRMGAKAAGYLKDTE